jgi:AraC family transcriptional activator FtrA
MTARILPTVSIHRVVVLALPGVVLLDLAAPTHLFGHCGEGRYDLIIASVAPGEVLTSTGLGVVATHGLEACRVADTLVVPGISEHSAPPPGEVLAALRAADERGARIMSICTGAFVLGYAGLLAGRRATTHWHSADELAHRFPEVEVDPHVLYVDEGQILTSAGVASGIDLCLHVVRRDHGAAVAAAMPRTATAARHSSCSDRSERRPRVSHLALRGWSPRAHG